MIRHLRSRHYHPKECYHEMTFGETFTGPSLTVPDQSLSLKDLLERYVMGQNVETFKGVYNGDQDDIPENIDRMDHLEKLDLARQVRGKIAETQAALSAAQVSPKPVHTDLPKTETPPPAPPA